MKKAPEQDYSIESGLNEAGFARYEALFAENGMPRQEHSLNWRYTRNPTEGTSVVNFALSRETGDTGAVYAVMGVDLLHDGQRRPGAQSLDTLTDAQHRRKGLFPYLARHCYNHLAKSGCLAVYGFPNANSCPTFKKHLGWTIYGQVDFLIRPLRTGYFVEGLLARAGLGWLGKAVDLQLPVARPRPARVTLRPVTRFGARHEAVWREVAGHARIAVDRSADYLNWRLFDHPDAARYRIVEAVAGEEVLGFAAWRVERKHNGQIGYLMECLARDGRDDLRKLLLRHALHDMKAAHADLVMAWSPPHQPGTQSLRRCGFLPMPERLRPIDLYWGAKIFAPGVSFGATDWYISYLDSDTI